MYAPISYRARAEPKNLKKSFLYKDKGPASLQIVSSNPTLIKPKSEPTMGISGIAMSVEPDVAYDNLRQKASMLKGNSSKKADYGSQNRKATLNDRDINLMRNSIIFTKV